MTMNLTKISAATGVAYLLKTVARRDGAEPPVKGAAAYYNQPGTPPGVWMGSSVAALGLTEGEAATRLQAELLFSALAHPVLGTPLGQAPRQLHAARAQETIEQVSGFDLTFTMPKSLSILWGTADRETQARIMDAHREAIRHAVRWFETEVASTRSGRGGVASSSVDGVVAIAYEHFETRDGDPHLHTHVALANRVRRTSDGKWLTLDGRSVYRSAVAMSELHENALLDLLHDRLGLVFTERDRPDARSTRSVVADVAGFPTDLVDRFSSRKLALRQRRRTLESQWLADHPDTDTVPSAVQAALDAQAWRETRKPKEAVAAPLSALSHGWREQLRQLGYDARALLDRLLGHERSPAAATRVRDATTDQLARLAIAHHRLNADGNKRSLEQITDADTEAWLEDHAPDDITAHLATAVHGTLTRRRATWSRFNARAEVERLTRLVRFRPGEREQVIDAVTDAALALCVPITPHRYELPDEAASDARLAYGSTSLFDNPNLRLFTSQDVLDAEAFLDSLTTVEGVHLSDDVVTAALADWHGPRLADDQAAAVRHLTGDPHALTALVGPAGAGKTTTMRAVHQAWTSAHGRASVIGLAPSARAAHELATSVGVDAHTLAMLLARNSPDARAQRSARRADLASALASTSPRRRAAATRALAAMDTEEASYILRPGTLVIVDEASMCSTHDLAALARLAVDAGAKIALVGDPAQLDAIDAGGFLGWCDRQGKAHRLTSLFRFTAEWEAAASLRLRAGDASVILPTDGDSGDAVTYADAGRIRDGETAVMLDGAYEAVRSAQRAGRTAVLVAATNEHVADLNLRTTLDRRQDGEVDTTRLVPLRGDTDAGVGDLIYARLNDYGSLRDDQGTPVHNGDLLRISSIADAGSARCVRIDSGATISLPAKYLREHCELGYALTAHRAQGITVDEAHLFIPYGARMTRELLYVAMTRGRSINTAWVGLPDEEDLAHEHRSPWQQDDDGLMRRAMPTGASILARAMSAVGAEQTAHEQREAEIAAHTSLQRLVSEHEVLASHAVAPLLATHLQNLHGDVVADAMTSSPCWDALVSTFRHAHAVNPGRAMRLLAIPPTRAPSRPVQGTLPLWDGDPDTAGDIAADVPRLREAHDEAVSTLARLVADGAEPGELAAAEGAVAETRAALRAADMDPAAITHWRLAAALVDPAPIAPDDPAWLAGLVVPIATADTSLADLAHQSETLIGDRVTHLARELHDTPPSWVPTTDETPDPQADPEGWAAWQQALLAVAIYRDTWDVTAPSPLGPEPVGDRRQARHWQHARDALTHWADPTPRSHPDLSRPPEVDLHAEVDWAERDSGEGFIAPEPEWIPSDPDGPRPLDDPDPDPEPEPWDDLYLAANVPTMPSWRDGVRPAPLPDDAALDRIHGANAAAWTYWTTAAAQPGSWVRPYLANRGLSDAIQPAHAPAGWTSTLDHLRQLGFDDATLLEAGLVTRASTGRLTDRFRDRLALPVHDTKGRIAGFTARANPDEITARPDTPKYLNTAATAAYDKGRLLYGLDPDALARLAAGGTPVLVEGPLDRAAVEALGLDGVVPLATCGTAVTADHLAVLASTGSLERLICAFDRDGAGQKAAAALWALLGPDAAGTVRQAVWDGAKDPGELIETGQSEALAAALTTPRSLACAIVDRQFAMARSLDFMEDQLYLVRLIARQVAPTLSLEAISEAQDAIVESLGDRALVDRDVITVAFAEALGVHEDAAVSAQSTVLEPPTSWTEVNLR